MNIKISFTLILLFLFSCSHTEKNKQAMKQYKITELDKKPHGVSTLTDQKGKLLTPIEYKKSESFVIDAIKKSLKKMGDNKIIFENEIYMHIEFYTFLGFTDDVEFYLDKDNKLVHFKSQSRVGYTDFGTNRSRMKKLVKLIKTNL